MNALRDFVGEQGLIVGGPILPDTLAAC